MQSDNSEFLPVTTLPGVGEARRRALESLGIKTVGDMLRHYPRAYQHRGVISTVADASEAYDELLRSFNPNTEDKPPHQAPRAFILTVDGEPTVRLIRRGMSILRFRAFDETGFVLITYFNQDYLKRTFKTGETYRFWGVLTRERGVLSINSPSFEPVKEGSVLPEYVAVYPLASPLTQKQVAGFVEAALRRCAASLYDPLDDCFDGGRTLREKYDLCTLAYAFENIHHPSDEAALDHARRRLAFDEFFYFALSIANGLTTSAEKASAVMRDTDTAPLLKKLPYKLTGAQSRAIKEIADDMACRRKDSPMRRILVGDVGCGKTVCAAAAVYIAVSNGYKAAVMAPTEILATQHYAELEPLFTQLGISTALLTGSTGAKMRRDIKAQLAGGGLDVVIGTHALLEDDVRFDRLGLVVTDEQHRFGVAQRDALANKSKGIHSLVMSATPIPRTLSLVLWGDLDISRIDEMPPGRQRVDTFVVDESYRPRLDAFIKKQVDEGHLVYIVCPSIDEAPEQDVDSDDYGDVPLTGIPLINGEDSRPPLKAAVVYARELAERLPSVRVELLHGRMNGTQKDKVMSAFIRGDANVLVSTTVIEVGVNVPEATLMIVENAERFGLSQLHQLRGRVGRGSARSYCVLVSDVTAGPARERLNVMRTVYDGFEVAERDLAQRGPGEIISETGTIKQHGALSFRIAGGCTDSSLMSAAFTEARELVKNDPGLSAHEQLRRHLPSDTVAACLN